MPAGKQPETELFNKLLVRDHITWAAYTQPVEAALLQDFGHSRVRSAKEGCERAAFSLLHRRGLFLTDAGQPLLNPAREFLLPGELDFRVFLSHPKGTVPAILDASMLLPPAAT